MRLATLAPSGWDARIAFPVQSVGFAEAARALGHRPLFAEDDRGMALVLIRRVAIPFLAGWTARAKVYAHACDASFLAELVDLVRGLGASHVKLGDSIWGSAAEWPEDRREVRRVAYDVLLHDLASDTEILARARRPIRRNIRKATAEVTVAEVRTGADLRDYLFLTEQTGRRMRTRDVAAVYPASYFEALLREMVPRKQAVLFIARADDAPLAGGAFLISPQRFVQIHGCSTRDRALTPKQGPTAVFWHAMRRARAEGCAVFDMGAVTPTADPAHPHYSVYEYKKLWGGRLAKIESTELVLAPWKHRFQSVVLAPMWDRLHPLYLGLFGDCPRRAVAGGSVPVAELPGASPVLALSGHEQQP